MSDLISRSALIQELSKSLAYIENGDIRYGIEISIYVTKKQPPVETVCGEWKSREQYNDYLWAECSECGFRQEAYKVIKIGNSSCDYVGVKWNFCPKCGADMRKKVKKTEKENSEDGMPNLSKTLDETLERIGANVKSCTITNAKIDASAEVAIQELEQYRELGTLEEVRTAAEKQKAKKIRDRKIMRDFYNRPYAIKGDCPICGALEIMSIKTDYCHVCGQKLDWSVSE